MRFGGKGRVRARDKAFVEIGLGLGSGLGSGPGSGSVSEARLLPERAAACTGKLNLPRWSILNVSVGQVMRKDEDSRPQWLRDYQDEKVPYKVRYTDRCWVGGGGPMPVNKGASKPVFPHRLYSGAQSYSASALTRVSTP